MVVIDVGAVGTVAIAEMVEVVGGGVIVDAVVVVVMVIVVVGAVVVPVFSGVAAV